MSSALDMELVPLDVIENILERLDVETLGKFKSVSKQWKSTIESSWFHRTRLMHQHKHSGDKDTCVLLVSQHDPVMKKLVFGSSSSSVRMPTPWKNKAHSVCHASCDGLICLFGWSGLSSVVFNPTTRWHRIIPPCNSELAMARNSRVIRSYASAGFGKDTINGTYKLFWLCNHNVTGCEVFDFATNAWRYVVTASPYRVLHTKPPVYLDGSLHWFAVFSGETMVLSFNLHNETFQVVSKTPFVNVKKYSKIGMYSLNDHLCVSEKNWPSLVIWSLESDNKTWKRIYTIDLNFNSGFFPRNYCLLFAPLAVLGNDMLLFYFLESGGSLATYDPKTKLYDIAYNNTYGPGYAYAICYVPSLISIS